MNLTNIPDRIYFYVFISFLDFFKRMKYIWNIALKRINAFNWKCFIILAHTKQVSSDRFISWIIKFKVLYLVFTASLTPIWMCGQINFCCSCLFIYSYVIILFLQSQFIIYTNREERKKTRCSFHHYSVALGRQVDKNQ